MLYLSVMQEALVSALKALSSDVNKSHPYVMLSANAVELTLRTQNGSVQTVHARVETQGEKIVDFATFSKLVNLSYEVKRTVKTDRYGNKKTIHSKIPSRIDLTGSGEFLEMRAGGNLTRFKSFDSERQHFVVPVAALTSLGAVDASRLQAFLVHALKCTSKDENRPVLWGINFHRQGSVIELATADGIRLCTATLDFYPVSDAPVAFTLPASKALSTLASADGCIHLAANDTHVQFSYQGDAFGEDKAVVVAKMEGVYPDYRVVIPRKIQATLALDTSYKASITRLQKTLKRFARCFSIRLVSQNGSLSITGKDENQNALSAVIEGQWEKSAWDSHVDLWLNPRLLATTLANMAVNEPVRIGFQGTDAPIQVTRQGASVVIMPMSKP